MRTKTSRIMRSSLEMVYSVTCVETQEPPSVEQRKTDMSAVRELAGLSIR